MITPGSHRPTLPVVVLDLDCLGDKIYSEDGNEYNNICSSISRFQVFIRKQYTFEADTFMTTLFCSTQVVINPTGKV